MADRTTFVTLPVADRTTVTERALRAFAGQVQGPHLIRVGGVAVAAC